MGRYFKAKNDKGDEVPLTKELVAAAGRRLNGSDFLTLKGQLKPGEALGYMGDRAAYVFCALIPDEAEFKHFNDQYQQGQLVARSFFALPAESFA